MTVTPPVELLLLVELVEQEKRVSSSQSDLSALPPEKAMTLQQLQQHQQLKSSSGATRRPKRHLGQKAADPFTESVCVRVCVYLF